MSIKREYEKKRKGHVWLENESGEVDIFGYTCGEYCNGPVCIKCGYGFCHHCNDLPEQKCGGKKKK